MNSTKKLHEMTTSEAFFSMLNPLGENFDIPHVILVLLFGMQVLACLLMLPSLFI